MVISFSFMRAPLCRYEWQPIRGEVDWRTQFFVGERECGYTATATASGVARTTTDEAKWTAPSTSRQATQTQLQLFRVRLIGALLFSRMDSLKYKLQSLHSAFIYIQFVFNLLQNESRAGEGGGNTSQLGSSFYSGKTTYGGAASLNRSRSSAAVRTQTRHQN